MALIQTAPIPNQPLLVFEGGLFVLLVRALHLSGSSLRSTFNRTLFWTALAWLPPVLFAAIGESSLSAPLDLGILNDISFHVRCLVAIPLLVAMENRIQKEFGSVIPAFYKRGMFGPEGSEKLAKLAERIRKFQVAQPIDPLLFAAALLIVQQGLYIDVAAEISTWKNLDSTPFQIAQMWNNWISLPLYYFFAFRWLWRFIAWGVFIVRVALLNPELQSLHPDRMGGLGFLLRYHKMFGICAFAISSVASANIAMRVLYDRLLIDDFVDPFLFYVFIVVFFMSAPLFIFSPFLIRARNQGVIRYSQFSNLYASNFDGKWLDISRVRSKDVLGTPDIQSLNDLHGSYRSQTQMRVLLPDMRTLTVLAIFVVVPFLPLLLFKFPAKELVEMIVKYFFHL